MSRRADRAALHAATTKYRTGSTILLAVGCALAAGTARAQVDEIIANGYHFQQTAFYCGPGSMEMMLDSPDVTGTNGVVATAIANANAGNIPNVVFENGKPTVVLGTPTTGDLGLQNSLYGAAWGPFTLLAFSRNTGTAPASLAAVMNGADSAPNGIHNYANWNFPPGVFTNGVLASRTVADAIHDFKVPATVMVENGAHWIDVNGVSTNVPAVRNGNYQINGFYVRDPWTGFALANGIGNINLGFNTYLRYGWDNLPGGGVRLAPWFREFNPSGPRGLPPNSYSIVVEPIGPELPDTNDLLPTPPPELASAIDLATALADAANDLNTDLTLKGDVEASGGSFDTSTTDDKFITLLSDTGGQGDWLIPFDGSGGVNDVTGVLLIDAFTGVIDEATWFDGTDGVNSMTLPQVYAMFQDEFNPATQPNENLISDELARDLPEPKQRFVT
jgi:hypothetical protein